MRKVGFGLVGVFGVLACVFAFVARVHGQDDGITKTLTFDMPSCPIRQISVPPTTREFKLPEKNPLGAPFTVAGTIQVADQSGGVIFKVSTTVDAELDHLSFDRTVNTIQHLTGQIFFDHGCTQTDPYGSRDCTWPWADRINANYQGALLEDITSGKFVVDLKINNQYPLSFSCPVCGSSCSFKIPQQLDQGRWNDLWPMMIRIIRFSLGTVASPN